MLNTVKDTLQLFRFRSWIGWLTLFGVGSFIFGFPQILNLSEYEFAFRSNFHNSSTIYTTNFPILHSAWSFMKINEISKADNYFNGLVNSDLTRIEKNKKSLRVFRYYIELACIYSARGDTANAIHYLMLLKKQKTGCLWLVHLLKYSPMLDNIRNEPEFTEYGHQCFSGRTQADT